MKTKEYFGFLIFLIVFVLFIHIIIIISFWYIFEKMILGNDKIVISGKKKYVFIENDNVSITTKRFNNISYNIVNSLLNITYANNLTNILIKGKSRKNGYAWDGCSPKLQIFDLIFGTPDGILNTKTNKPAAYYASMVHDILYQYHHQIGGELKRKQVDLIFLDELRKNNFRLAFIYYLFVRIFGWAYWRSKKRKSI